MVRDYKKPGLARRGIYANLLKAKPDLNTGLRTQGLRQASFNIRFEDMITDRQMNPRARSNDREAADLGQARGRGLRRHQLDVMRTDIGERLRVWNTGCGNRIAASDRQPRVALGHAASEPVHLAEKFDDEGRVGR